MEDETNLRRIRHGARSLALPSPRWQSAAYGLLLFLASCILAACSSSGALPDGGCSKSCMMNSDCPQIVCTCSFDGGHVNVDGFCSDGCCGGCPPGCQ
jgi:hypothetical protein